MLGTLLGNLLQTLGHENTVRMLQKQNNHHINHHHNKHHNNHSKTQIKVSAHGPDVGFELVYFTISVHSRITSFESETINFTYLNKRIFVAFKWHKQRSAFHFQFMIYWIILFGMCSFTFNLSTHTAKSRYNSRETVGNSLNCHVTWDFTRRYFVSDTIRSETQAFNCNSGRRYFHFCKMIWICYELSTVFLALRF